MNATGIGYAGIDGAWWLPASRPFRLESGLRDELARIGDAIFRLFDAVSKLLQEGDSLSLSHLMAHKIPERWRLTLDMGAVQAVRPDFQLAPLPHGGYRPVVTELEICPSAQGFTHAMQVGYGLPDDLLQGTAAFLAGRPLLIVFSSRWSAFLFDQLAFCRALDQAGVNARVLLDQPFMRLSESISSGRAWKFPIFGVSEPGDGWNLDLPGRLGRSRLLQYVADDETWSGSPGEAVIFRFGYLDHYAPAELGAFSRWRDGGAIFMNPPNYFPDSKALMAAIGLSEVRDEISNRAPSTLRVLDQCIPETILVTESGFTDLLREREHWVLKHAGFDGGEQAWGGRSLQVGADLNHFQWESALRQALALPWPVVAQRIVVTSQVDIEYFSHDGRAQTMQEGNVRLRAFYLRGSSGSGPFGAHITVAKEGHRVSEGTDSVQAPVVFV